jgi:hypothetical protein
MSLQRSPDLEKLDDILASKVDLPDDELSDRLSTILSGLDYAKTSAVHSHSGIFWALTRLFGCFDQLTALCDEYSTTRADRLTFFAALEIEHFLIRLRTLLDEVAYAIRTRIPNNVRGLSPLGGPGPIEYKHFSINTLQKFVAKNPDFCQHLTQLIENNKLAIGKFIDLRDDIAHFRAKAIIFPGPPLSVGFVGARDAARTKNLEHTDLLGYFNDATIWIWRFLQFDLVQYFRGRVEDGEIEFKPLGIGLTRISMPGIRRFKKLLTELEYPSSLRDKD